MLRDAEWREKTWIVRENFSRCVAAVKFAEQAGDGLHDERIGIAIKETFAVAKPGNKPQFGKTAGNLIFSHAQFRHQRRTLFRSFHEKREAILAVF